MASKPTSIPLFWRFRRLWNNVRCGIGLHQLKAFRDLGDGVNVDPSMPVHAKPGPKDFRKCEWCGARWHGAYDGIEPFWKRVA